MKIGILGCGWVGEKLGESLLVDSHTVFTTNTTQQKAKKMEQKGFNASTLHLSAQPDANYRAVKTVFQALDLIVISVPIGRRQSTESIEETFTAVLSFLKNYKKPLIFLSSTGIYPNTNAELNEDYPDIEALEPRRRKVENELKQHFPQINLLRLAGIFGGDRVFANYFSNRTLKGAENPVNHIHVDDIIGVIKAIMVQKISGKTLNVVAPEHPKKSAVVKMQVADLSTVAPSSFDMEKGGFKVVSGKKLQEELGYVFKFPDPKKFTAKK